MFLKYLLKTQYAVTFLRFLRLISVIKLIKMTTVNNTLKENKKNNSTEIILSKRTTWNTRRKYNYKYITTVF